MLSDERSISRHSLSRYSESGESMKRASALVLSTLSLIASTSSPALAQPAGAPVIKGNSHSAAPFQDLEGKWVTYFGGTPIRLVVKSREGKPHVEYVSGKTGEPDDCDNVKYENGLLSFDFPGKPVPTYKLRLAEGGKQLAGEMVIPSFPFPLPVLAEKVTAWPSAEEIAAKAGSAGPIIVRQ